MFFSQISIEITNICNFSCNFCPIGKMQRKRGYMPFETVKRIVDEISELHLLSSDGHINPYIVGEPLIHPQADQIFKYIKSKNLKILLNTNASLLTSDTIKLLYDIHIDKITINLSKNKDEFYLRKPKLSYEEHIGNVTEAVKQHIRKNPSTELELLILLHKHDIIKNSVEIQSIMQILDHIGIDQMLFMKDVFASFRYNFFRKIQLPFVIRKEILPRVNLAIGASHSWAGNTGTDYGKVKKAIIGSCNALRKDGQIAILADGTYTLCCLDYEGRTKLPFKYEDCTFSKLFNSKEFKRIASEFRKCHLPYEFCKYCRGGDTNVKWLLNQLFSCIYYNIPHYKVFRRLANIMR